MEKVTIRKASQGGTMKLKEALTKKQFVVTSEIQAAIEQAAGEGWIIVDMKKDWKTMFPAKSQ